MDWDDKELIDDVAGSLEEYEERPQTTHTVVPLTCTEWMFALIIVIPVIVLLIVVIATVTS